MITNTSKPTPSVTNSSKVVQYETWDTNTTTFDSEVRSWDEMQTEWTGTTKVTPSITNTARP